MDSTADQPRPSVSHTLHVLQGKMRGDHKWLNLRSAKDASDLAPSDTIRASWWHLRLIRQEVTVTETVLGEWEKGVSK